MHACSHVYTRVYTHVHTHVHTHAYCQVYLLLATLDWRWYVEADGMGLLLGRGSSVLNVWRALQLLSMQAEAVADLRSVNTAQL